MLKYWPELLFQPAREQFYFFSKSCSEWAVAASVTAVFKVLVHILTGVS